MTPPIRFLAVVAVGWIGARLLVLLPEAGTRAAPVPPAPVGFARGVAPDASYATWQAGKRIGMATPRLGERLRIAALPGRQPATGPRTTHPLEVVPSAEPPRRTASVEPIPLPVGVFPRRLAGGGVSVPVGPATTRSDAPLAVPGDMLAATRRVARWSGDAWALVRSGEDTGSLAPGTALLGGSQAGARLLYRVTEDGPVSLSARLSSPLRRRGAEAALGVDWRPLARVPVRVLAERRQAVSGGGRSAFALLAYGGVSERPVAAGFRLDGYAQGGVVGTRSRDLFADGAVTLVRPLTGGLAIGAGAWGGAQPGAARIDVGPRLTTSIPVAGGRARVSLDWRFRIAGNAAPASGPSLTVGAGF